MQIVVELFKGHVSILVHPHSPSVIFFVVGLDHVDVVGKDLKTSGELLAIFEFEVKLVYVIEELSFVVFTVVHIGSDCSGGGEKDNRLHHWTRRFFSLCVAYHVEGFLGLTCFLKCGVGSEMEQQQHVEQQQGIFPVKLTRTKGFSDLCYFVQLLLGLPSSIQLCVSPNHAVSLHVISRTLTVAPLLAVEDCPMGAIPLRCDDFLVVHSFLAASSGIPTNTFQRHDCHRSVLVVVRIK